MGLLFENLFNERRFELLYGCVSTCFTYELLMSSFSLCVVSYLQCLFSFHGRSFL